MPDDTPKGPEHKSREEVKLHSFSTAIHEVGHAVCALDLGVKEVIVQLRMNQHFRETGFAARKEIYVHGSHTINEPDLPRVGLEDIKPLIATVAFAGLLSELLWGPQFAAAKDDELYVAINSSLVKWSDEDKQQVEFAGDKKRQAFNRAAAIVRKSQSDIAKYVDFIWADFLSDESDVLNYVLNTKRFQTPVIERSEPFGRQ